MRCILVPRQFSTIDESFSYVIWSKNSRNSSELLHIEHLQLDILPNISQTPSTYCCHISDGKSRIWREIAEAGSRILDDAI